MREDPLVAQEDKEALQPAAACHDRPWRQPLLEGSGDPGVDIRGCGLGQVLIEGSLTGFGHQHRKTFERTKGAFLSREGIVAGAQMGEIICDPVLVQGTQKREPTELREGMDHGSGL
jgi:hypothetical protein